MKLLVVAILAMFAFTPACTNKKSDDVGEDTSNSTAKPGNSDEGLPGYLVDPSALTVESLGGDEYLFTGPAGGVTGTDEQRANLYVAVWAIDEVESADGTTGKVTLRWTMW